MAVRFYETHQITDAHIPFLFHLDHVINHEIYYMHWHENLELLYCISGSGFVYSEKEKISVRAGDLYIVNSNELHSSSSDDNLTYYCLIVDCDFLRNNGLDVSRLKFDKLVRDEQTGILFEAIISLINQKEKDHLYVASIRMAVLKLMVYLCSHYCTFMQTIEINSSVPGERVKKAVVYIHNHLAEPLTLESIASHVGVSKYHLSREFKTITGATVCDAINLIRCSSARRMIRDGIKISAAAEACGYRNLSYFSVAFKKVFHQTPSSFAPNNSDK